MVAGRSTFYMRIFVRAHTHIQTYYVCTNNIISSIIIYNDAVSANPVSIDVTWSPRHYTATARLQPARYPITSALFSAERPPTPIPVVYTLLYGYSKNIIQCLVLRIKNKHSSVQAAMLPRVCIPEMIIAVWLKNCSSRRWKYWIQENADERVIDFTSVRSDALSCYVINVYIIVYYTFATSKTRFRLKSLHRHSRVARVRQNDDKRGRVPCTAKRHNIIILALCLLYILQRYLYYYTHPPNAIHTHTHTHTLI